jgi:hypothetical protein
MRIHNPNRFVVQWSEIQHIHCLCSCVTVKFSNQYHSNHQATENVIKLKPNPKPKPNIAFEFHDSINEEEKKN